MPVTRLQALQQVRKDRRTQLGVVAMWLDEDTPERRDAALRALQWLRNQSPDLGLTLIRDLQRLGMFDQAD